MSTSTSISVLVTGTSGGLGSAIAERLLTNGWRVTGLDRTPGQLQSENFEFVACDLLDPANVSRVVENLGQFTAFVHAAGFMHTGELGKMDLHASNAMWRVHVEAAIQIADLITPAMNTGSRIVMIGSRTANGVAGRSQYAATKSALVGLARSWALELAPRRITVNIVSPAATRTGMLTDPSRSSSPPLLPPLGRYIEPTEVAGYVAFLLGEDAAAITGQHLMICGGASL